MRLVPDYRRSSKDRRADLPVKPMVGTFIRAPAFAPRPQVNAVANHPGLPGSRRGNNEGRKSAIVGPGNLDTH